MNKMNLNTDKMEVLWVCRKADQGIQIFLLGWGYSSLHKLAPQCGSAAWHLENWVAKEVGSAFAQLQQLHQVIVFIWSSLAIVILSYMGPLGDTFHQCSEAATNAKCYSWICLQLDLPFVFAQHVSFTFLICLLQLSSSQFSDIPMAVKILTTQSKYIMENT